MTFIIKEHPTNHYLVCTEMPRFKKDNLKINGWWPDLNRAVKFEKVDEVLNIFSEIKTNPKCPVNRNYEILEINE